MVRVVSLSIYLPLYCWAFYPISLELGLCISKACSSKLEHGHGRSLAEGKTLRQHNLFWIWFDFFLDILCLLLFGANLCILLSGLHQKLNPIQTNKKQWRPIFVLIYLCSFFVTLLCSSIFCCYYSLPSISPFLCSL